MLRKKYIINDTYLFDPMRKTVFNQLDQSEKIVLGHNESDILLTLIEKRSEVLSKEAINKFVWSDNGISVNQSSVVQSMSTLRKMLNDPTKEPLFIQTVPKKGYQFIGSVNEVIEAPEIIEEICEPVAVDSEPNPASCDETKAQDKKPGSLMIPVILTMTSLVFFLYILFFALDKKNFQLEKIDVINNVPIYTLPSQNQVYVHTPLMKQNITEFINTSKNHSGIDKIIVNINSRHNLIINVIYSTPTINKSYEIVANISTVGSL